MSNNMFYVINFLLLIKILVFCNCTVMQLFYFKKKFCKILIAILIFYRFCVIIKWKVLLLSFSLRFLLYKLILKKCLSITFRHCFFCQKMQRLRVRSKHVCFLSDLTSNNFHDQIYSNKRRCFYLRIDTVKKRNER